MDEMTLSRFEGGVLGLALGDALGAPFEGGPLERFVWRLIGKTDRGQMRWTDDTQMSLDLAECLVANGAVDPEDLAQRFARSYRWSRGYGPGAARVLKRIARGADWRAASRSVYAEGSFGNGGAMRAPIVGLFYATRPEELAEAARQSARVTHAHPLAIEGAVLVASATARAVASKEPVEILQAAASRCELAPFRERLAIALGWLDAAESPVSKEVSEKLGNGIAAVESCVTAVYIASRFLGESFIEMQAFVASCGGDVDTIGAMAGAVWGAMNGASSLPEDRLLKLEQRERLLAVAGALHERSGSMSERRNESG
jgi:ADP-ribosylglycohydrolase